MKTLLTIAMLFACAEAMAAQEFANIEYLCADWGPAMTLPTKPGEKPQFSETEEEVYFLKQVTRFTRKKFLVPDLLTGSKTEDLGKGISIYLCKMRSDGSAKTEIKELWHAVRYPIDTQAQSTWMNVCVKTRQIVVSVTYGGSDLTGLWVMNLDGSELKRIYSPDELKGDVATVNHPSWTPDGQSIVFDQHLRAVDLHQYRIARCDTDGTNVQRLTDGPEDRQPSVSPGGDGILYVHNPRKKVGEKLGKEMWVAQNLWLMSLDGTNKREIPNPEARPNWPAKGIPGIWPAWSPNGKRIYVTGMTCIIVEVSTGKVVVQQSPQLDGGNGDTGYAQWGRLGIVGYCRGGILLTDSELKEAKWLASSRLANCSESKSGDCKW